ncbi:Phosphatidylglycerol/phosphatidylinositol transfer protein [Podila horticola]|nr:Phosphatidylglycerol/phosphatidylinositol transfer protein [Podila horticola]
MRLSTVLYTTLAVALGLASASHAWPNPLSSILSPHAQDTDSIKSCGTEDDLLQIEYIDINPDPPARGKNLTIDARGILHGDVVEGAKISILVKLGLVKLLQKELDFCEEAAKVDKNCPLLAGPQELHHTVELPKEIPPGKYTATVKVKNPDGEQVACLTATAIFKITSF